MLFTLNWIYNDIGAANSNFLLRNLLNALGFSAFGAGAAHVACLHPHTLNAEAWQWLLCIAAVLFTTIHVQDLYDQQGDKLRGRSTAPLVLGDTVARYTIAIAVALWSVYAPAFWHLQWKAWVLPLAVGGLLVLRVLLIRDEKGDRCTFKVWALWIIVLYALPVIRNANAFDTV